MTEPRATTADLLKFIRASPTPQHCVAEVARRLDAAGFSGLEAGDPWKLSPGEGYHVARDGGLVAFRVGSEPAAKVGFRLVGAHTDSPTLRIKPLADVTSAGYRQLGVEIYGSALTYTWLDRDLGLAGSVVLRGNRNAGRLEQRLVHIDRPMLRVPSLAIHLNRDVRKDGLKLNDQKHLAPILALAPETDSGDRVDSRAEQTADDPGALRRLLANELSKDLSKELAVEPDQVLSWDLIVTDCTPPTLGGQENEFIFSPRLDNQAMCHAALTALLRAGKRANAASQVICLYNHEEVGSASVSGAGGPLVEDILRRLAEVEGPGAIAGALTRAVAHSTQISADMAHAIHPNYVDRHEPEHHPRINAGPVIKINAQQRYATDAQSAGLFEALCQEAEVPYQKFVNRTDLPCGGTIGPISAARLGVRTVDVGNPMLSMHSIREQGGAADPEAMTRVMTLFFAS